MKLKIIVLMFTAILVTGCGYEDRTECYLKESQKCATRECDWHAQQYCEKNY